VSREGWLVPANYGSRCGAGLSCAARPCRDLAKLIAHLTVSTVGIIRARLHALQENRSIEEMRE
jgi:hypothetical protein